MNKNVFNENRFVLFRQILFTMLTSALLGISHKLFAQTSESPHYKSQAPVFSEEFTASELNSAWTTWDGYALNNPSDTDNHASFNMTGSHLSISFPGDAEHNQWWLEHAQISRDYAGSGVYEIKVDVTIDGTQQFGIVFESAPGTFMMFMIYSYNSIRGYVEQFSNVNGVQHRTTWPNNSGYGTGLNVPYSGPFWLRVIVNDDPVPTNRLWTFQWSPDGASWSTIIEGVLETSDPSQQVGVINQVGIFAGNQPFDFSAFDLQIDYYRSYPSVETPVDFGPINLMSDAGNAQVSLFWNVADNAAGYSIYRSTSAGGPYTLLSTTPQTSYQDTDVVNGSLYAYVVTAYANGQESAESNEVQAIPNLPAPDNIIATPGNQQVHLSWDAVSGADDYMIYRSTTSGDSYTFLATITATDYVDIGLVNGTTYYYVLNASDNGSEGNGSDEIQATPYRTPVIPDAPNGLNASAGDGIVTLNWDSVSGVDGYRLYRRTGSNAYAEIYDGSDSDYTDTMVVNKTSYDYVATSYIGTDESEYSVNVSAIPQGVLAPLIMESGFE